jgi:hypothetical protein
MKFRVTASDEKCATMQSDNNVIGREAVKRGILGSSAWTEWTVELLKHVLDYTRLETFGAERGLK